MFRVPIGQIDDSPFQARATYDGIPDLAASLLDLAETVPETSGLLQIPPARLVTPGGASWKVVDPGQVENGTAGALAIPGARVQLAAGHRRLRAFRYLAAAGHGEYNTFPVEIEPFTDEQMANIAHAENAQREDLSPIEEAIALQKAMDALGWTQAQIGKRWGLTQAGVSNKLRLLTLPQWVQDVVHTGELSEKSARTALPLWQIPGVNIRPHSLKHNTRGDYMKAAEMRDYVRGVVNAQTGALNRAEWEPRDEWVPDPSIADVVGACGDCPHRLSVLRQVRCTNKKCYNAKERLHKEQVAGPAKAREVYDRAVPWTAEAPSWAVCHGCGRSSRDVGQDGWRQAPQRGSTYGRYRICPQCWELAGLPEPAPAETPEETPAPGPAPRPATVVATPPKMRKTEPPAPPPPPADVLTARILAGDALDARRVLVAIGPDGQGPGRHIGTGTYSELPGLITQALADYFQGNEPGNDNGKPAPIGTAEQIILMEV